MNKYTLKTFICIILFLSISILCKKNINIYNYIKENVYTKNITFSYYKKIYNKYLGGVFPINNINSSTSEPVFQEELNYKSYKDYENGIELIVENNYLIPTLNNGIVVYIGKKDKYENTIIIEDDNGINNWYGNICNSSVKLYDNIKKGSYLGESCNDHIYLAFEKNNIFLDYKKILKV